MNFIGKNGTRSGQSKFEDPDALTHFRAGLAGLERAPAALGRTLLEAI
jgi:hypothetical protein